MGCKKTTKEMIKVMQAYEDGAEIEFRVLAGSVWHSCVTSGPEWDWSSIDYRVKPKHREVWVNEYPDGNRTYHETGDSAACGLFSPAGETTHFREVLDDE